MRRYAKAMMASMILVAVAGCQTPYQDMGYAGGVAAAPITSDTYRISARGNGYTDPTVIQDYVLLKAAEITLQTGNTHFLIIDDRDATRQEFGSTPGTVQTNVIGNTAYSTYTPGATYSVVKPGQDVMVKLGKLPAGTNMPGAFDAAEVYAAINPRVLRPKK